MAESLLPIDRHQVPVTNCPPSFVRVQMHGKRRPPLAGRPFISGREKTASASVTLADNLRANAANRKKAVHGGDIDHCAARPSRGCARFAGRGRGYGGMS